MFHLKLRISVEVSVLIRVCIGGVSVLDQSGASIYYCFWALQSSNTFGRSKTPEPLCYEGKMLKLLFSMGLVHMLLSESSCFQAYLFC